MLLDTAITGALTAVTVFSSSFHSFLVDFVLFMLIWIAPWMAIYLTDYFLRRGRYDSGALTQTARGLYHRAGGIRWRHHHPAGRHGRGRILAAGLSSLDLAALKPDRLAELATEG